MKRQRIDKSVLQFGEPARVRDPQYRKSANGRPCDICRTTDTTVLAHINTSANSGMGLKASDDHSLFLCAGHHADFDASPDRFRWLVVNYLIPLREKIYRSWKHGC